MHVHVNTNRALFYFDTTDLEFEAIVEAMTKQRKSPPNRIVEAPNAHGAVRYCMWDGISGKAGYRPELNCNAVESVQLWHHSRPPIERVPDEG